MKQNPRAIRARRRAASAVVAVVLLVAAAVSLRARPQQAGQKPAAGLPSETPAQFKPTNDGFDYERRDVMIPMRDGVKLHTVILVPKGAKRAPILLTRTPYNATALTEPRRRARTSARSSTATTTPPRSSSKAATSAWSRTSAASTGRRATT